MVRMVDNDGVYISRRRRRQRGKKALVAVVGLAAVLGGGAYGVSALRLARDAAVIGDTGALAPAVTPSAAPSSAPSPAPSASPSAGARTTSTRLSGVPRSSRPSPTPSPAGRPDEQVAADQISRLLRAPRGMPSGGMVAAGEAITVATESGPDGSAIRVLSAHYDLTARGTLLGAADNGTPVGRARCTRNLLIDAVAQERPGILLCWRTSSGRSVVAVATNPTGRPAAAATGQAVDRAWRRLG